MAKNKALDGEAHTTISKKFTASASAFTCWRCNAEKMSRRKYCWQTSQGTKIICNGCNGFLQKQQKATKQIPSSPSTVVNKRKASQSATHKSSKKIQRKKSPRDSPGKTEASRHTIDDLFANSNKVTSAHRHDRVLARRVGWAVAGAGVRLWKVLVGV